MEVLKKYEKLKAILAEMKEVVVAYSGGVDSTFLLKVAYDVLGNKAFGVIAVSSTFPSREFEKAKKTAFAIGADIKIIETNELDNEKFRSNPINRCYFCKNVLFDRIIEIAKDKQYKNIVDGSNIDDKSDYRPGMKALAEKGICSPLQEAELTKADIRKLSQMLGLPTWNKEALACLSSRFPYGENISLEKLRMVDDIENFLFDLGFRNVRARHLKNTLKIEVSSDQISQFFQNEIRIQVLEKAKNIGYKYITIDLEGYRQGSMNEVLGKP